MVRTLSLICVTLLLSTSVLQAQTKWPGGSQPKTAPGLPKIAPPPAPPPPPRNPQYSLIMALVPSLSSECVQSELKLSDEQKSQLLAWSQKLQDDSFRSKQDETKANVPVRNEATEAFFAKTLSSAQYRRAQQLAARLAWVEHSFSRYGSEGSGPNLTRVSLMTLAKYPELGESLSLSPEQKKLIDATQLYSNSFLYLTPDQSKLAAELLGGTPEKPLAPVSETRTSIRAERPETRALALTTASDVRAELNLSDKQTEELSRLRDYWRGNRVKLQRESPQVQKQKFDELAADVGGKLAAILRPEQVLRLRQLERRSTLPHEYVLSDPGIARQLGLSNDQQEMIRRAADACGQLVQKAILTGTDVDAAEQTIRQAIAARRKAVSEILNVEQKSKLKELLGERFHGSYFDDRTNTILNPQEVEYGLYTNELAFLSRNPVVQSELKLSPQQIEAAKAAATAIDAKFSTRELYSPSLRGPDRKVYEERSQAIEKSLNELLTPGQSNRFHQLMIQSREQLSRPRFDLLPVTSVVAYPGVAEAIKLAASQKEQLHAGIDPDMVFTPEQKAMITELKGDLVQGDLTPPNQRASLLVQPEGRSTHLLDLNWARLKLTPEQVSKLVPVITRYQLAAHPSNVIQELGGEKDKLVAATQSFDRAVAAILTPAQQKALDQFKFQEAAASSYRTALARPDATSLVLSPAQLQQIAAIETRNRQWARLATRAEDYLPPRMPLDTVLLRLRDRLDERILAVLSDDQRAKWNDLMGGALPDLRKNTSIRLGKMPPGSEW